MQIQCDAGSKSDCKIINYITYNVRTAAGFYIFLYELNVEPCTESMVSDVLLDAAYFERKRSQPSCYTR